MTRADKDQYYLYQTSSCRGGALTFGMIIQAGTLPANIRFGEQLPRGYNVKVGFRPMRAVAAEVPLLPWSDASILN